MAIAALAVTRVSEPWQLWPAFLAMSAGWATMSSVMVNALLAPWFDRRLGMAISLALNGASCGGVIVAPLMILAIDRSEEHTSELQSLMRISYAVFCLKKKNRRKKMTCLHYILQF